MGRLIFCRDFLVRLVTHQMKDIEPQKAPPGAIPSVISQPRVSHVCILPAKPKACDAKPAPLRPKPKPEPTLEERVADEVEGRVNNTVGKFAIGYLIANSLDNFFHRDDK
jgi:hypothetical protein